MQITEGKIRKPFNILVHGVPGIGKSTFAADLDKPIFIGAEEQDELEAAKAPKITEFSQVFDQVSWLLKNKHDYKTLALDTIDSLEQLLHQSILNSDPKNTGSMNKAHGGYGAAYEKALNEMMKLRDLISELRDKKKMNICIICHTVAKKTSDPVTMGEYDEYQLTLHHKVQNLWVDWVSAVLFMNYVVEKNDDEKFAYGDGERVILTAKRPGHLAKNRYNFEYQMEMPVEHPASEFKRSLEKFYTSDRTPKDVRKSIDGLLENVQDEELKKKVVASLKGKDKVQSLEKIENRLKEIVNG